MPAPTPFFRAADGPQLPGVMALTRLNAVFEAAYELEPAHRELLKMASEHLSRARSLDRVVKESGYLIGGYAGPHHKVMNPAVAEARHQRAAAAKILADLFPDAEASGEIEVTMGEARSDLARKGAAARWGR